MFPTGPYSEFVFPGCLCLYFIKINQLNSACLSREESRRRFSCQPIFLRSASRVSNCWCCPPISTSSSLRTDLSLKEYLRFNDILKCIFSFLVFIIDIAVSLEKDCMMYNYVPALWRTMNTNCRHVYKIPASAVTG